MGSTQLNEMHEHAITAGSKRLHSHRGDELGHTHDGLGPGQPYEPPSMEVLRMRAEVDVEMSGVGDLLDLP